MSSKVTYVDWLENYAPHPYKQNTIKRYMAMLESAPEKLNVVLSKAIIEMENAEEFDVACSALMQNPDYDQINQTYRMLIAICNLVVKGLLQTNSDGMTRMMDFVDEQRMCRLYEKFILEYYRREHPELTARASQIPWQLDDGFSAMLPVMQSDIMLSKGNRTLIIDAKYYAHNTQMQYDVHTLHSGNLYQIFTYVKNKDAEYGDVPHEVSGMLLYARTDEQIQPDHVYHMNGNKISVRTLDLSCEFRLIAEQLDRIAWDHFV